MEMKHLMGTGKVNMEELLAAINELEALKQGATGKAVDMEELLAAMDELGALNQGVRQGAAPSGAHSVLPEGPAPSARPGGLSDEAMTPDFDLIATKLIEVLDPTDVADARPAITETLRQVWNARGAADRVRLEGATWRDARGPFVQQLERELRSLDR